MKFNYVVGHEKNMFDSSQLSRYNSRNAYQRLKVSRKVGGYIPSKDAGRSPISDTKQAGHKLHFTTVQFLGMSVKRHPGGSLPRVDATVSKPLVLM